MIGPTPNRSVSDVPDARTAVTDPFVRHLELAVETTDIVEQLDSQLVADPGDRRRGMEGLEEAIDVRSVDFLGDSTAGELSQQRMHATHDPASLVANVDVPFREQA
jgi:hypothetical protein